MSEQTITWAGQSGQFYTYYVYQLGQTTFKAVPGNYIVAKLVLGRYLPIYAGETNDLHQRLDVDQHHAAPCCKQQGATHVHVHTSSSGQLVRRFEELDIIKRWNPPCNG